MTTKELIQAFRQAADKEKALPMQNYMKNIAPFLGIPRPKRDEIQKPWLKYLGDCNWMEQQKDIKQLWDLDEREFQYAAMDGLFKCKAWKNKDALLLFERLIQSKSWWDTVDFIAPKLVGNYFLVFPDAIEAKSDNWMNSKNMWLQRTCLIYQLNYKTRTNFEHLKANIIPLLDSKEFFIQKAIGWALRQYARTNPDAVNEFANSYPLKPLSKREALKHFK